MPQRPTGPTQGPAAVEPGGEVIATFRRSETEELRVSIAEYLGSPYIALRVWAVTAGLGWRPVSRKGLSVRLGEAEGVAAALLDALGILNRP